MLDLKFSHLEDFPEDKIYMCYHMRPERVAGTFPTSKALIWDSSLFRRMWGSWYPQQDAYLYILGELGEF